MNTNSFYLISLPRFIDERGMMCVAECGKEIPFDIKRVFYDYNNSQSEETRGNHANKKSKFVFVCLHGSCSIKVHDGTKEEIFNLNDPQIALFVDNMIWKEMFNYSDDSVLLILSNEKYDQNEYIKDFEIFIKTKFGN